jgi:hypothetical protein
VGRAQRHRDGPRHVSDRGRGAGSAQVRGRGGAVSAEASDDEVIAVGILSRRRGTVLRCLWSVVACETQAPRAA